MRFISYMLRDTDTQASTGYIWCDKIENKLAVSFTKFCTTEFLRLIQEFPKSTPCLNDLKKALAFSNMNSSFVA